MSDCVLDFMDLSELNLTKIDKQDGEFRGLIQDFAVSDDSAFAMVELDNVYKLVDKMENPTSNDISNLSALIESVYHDFDYVPHADSGMRLRIDALIDCVVSIAIKNYTRVLFGNVDFSDYDSTVDISIFNEAMESLICFNGKDQYQDDDESESISKATIEAAGLLKEALKTRN